MANRKLISEMVKLLLKQNSLANQLEFLVSGEHFPHHIRRLYSKAREASDNLRRHEYELIEAMIESRDEVVEHAISTLRGHIEDTEMTKSIVEELLLKKLKDGHHESYKTH